MKQPRFYSRLAFSSLKRNKSTWLPYLLSCTGTVMMYLVMSALLHSPSLRALYGGRTIQQTLSFGVGIVLVFAVIFILYTHSFLLKRRQQEMGLYSVLGLEKKHLGCILLVETLFTLSISLLAGMALGALICKLMYLVILSMLGAAPSTPFQLPLAAFTRTALAFALIHLLTLLSTLFQVHMVSPVEMMRARQRGEKPVKKNGLLAFIGLALLAGGYALSLTAGNALQSLGTFFIAVLLVVLGTYALFLWGSVAGLKALQNNKQFYYRPTMFPVVGGMVHRMKRNAVGLATICILSTMVLVMVAATGSLFAGREDALNQFGRDAQFNFTPLTDNMVEDAWQIIRKEADQLDVPVEDAVLYRKIGTSTAMEGAPFADRSTTLGMSTYFTLVPWQDYAALFPDAPAIAPGEMLYFSAYGEDLPQDFVFHDGQDVPLTPLKRLAGTMPINEERNNILPSYTLILNPEDIHHIMGDVTLNTVFMFNTGDINPQTAWQLVDTAQKKVAGYMQDMGIMNITSFGRHIATDRIDLMALYGGLLFVAIFLGTLFLMALVLIIYYKQVSEGYEDRERYQIMRKVGMSETEVKAAIKSQVRMVFFAPLLLSGLHMLAAFNITLKVLEVFMLSNARLFALVSIGTFLVFALFYYAVYMKTAQSYYKVINA